MWRPAVDPAVTTVAVEFNDLDAVARALRTGRIAAVLTEPALTNIGIVLPDEDFHAGLRGLCDETGTLLMIDETHTFSAGPGGATGAWGLRPDIVTIGKAIAGGIPIGAFGLSGPLARSLLARIGEDDADIVDVGGVGGTLAGNALSTAAARATLEHVLTDRGLRPHVEPGPAPGRPGGAGHRRATGCPGRCRASGPGPSTGSAPPPRSTGPSRPGPRTARLNEYLHLYMSNRGVLITPFHNMILTCPETTVADVDRHGELFGAALGALTG